MEHDREILTIGHSNHPSDRFLELVRAGRIEAVADVRRFPASRRNPQFAANELAASLSDAGIVYEPYGDQLGGRRRSKRPRADSQWRNASFAAYAEYMEGAEFAAGLRRLEELARLRRTAVMCAEGPWWRCHRRLIADALSARGWRVLHLLPDGRLAPHPETLELR